MDRRAFLKITVAAAAGASGLQGCGKKTAIPGIPKFTGYTDGPGRGGGGEERK
jgi:hypothetical protein